MTPQEKKMVTEAGMQWHNYILKDDPELIKLTDDINAAIQARLNFLMSKLPEELRENKGE